MQMDPHICKVCRAEGFEWQQCNHRCSPSSRLLCQASLCVTGGTGVAKGFLGLLQLFELDGLSLAFSSVQSLSRVRLCDPMNHSTPGLPVQHQLPEFTQTHVHRVCDAIQPSHPLLSPSPPAPNPS